MSSIETHPDDEPQADTADTAASSSPLLPVFRTNSLANAQIVADIADEDAVDAGFLGFTSTVFAQTCLPYRDPMREDPNLRAWTRQNGPMILRVEPALLDKADGTLEYAMPFGKYPRLILPWLTTQIVRRQSDREKDGSLSIDFSASLPKFLADLGQEWGGKKGQLILDQLPRLFGARISVSQVGETPRGNGRRMAAFQIAQGYELWFDKNGGLDDSGGLWGNTVTVSGAFVQDVLDAPVPIDLRAVAVMSGSGPMAMDILSWLNYRLPRAKRPSLVTWAQLNSQFGAQYARPRAFKAQFVKHLPAVQAVYREARFEVEETGLRIYPSPPAVQRRAVKD